ncbi:MAG: hypothetical protein GX900_06525 [Clostridiaceae bacterium]|nr:hypothetical protein [Clostridiaceae bacterium]
MLTGKTKTGFEFEISESALNNYELFEVLSEVDSNPLKMPQMVNLLLGEEQKKALMEHLRTEDGTVPIDAVSKEILDIFSSARLKNS